MTLTRHNVSCLLLVSAAAGAQVAPDPAETVLYADKAVEFASLGGKVSFPVDPGAEHIYGISYEAQGAPGTMLEFLRFETYRADGSERQNVSTHRQYPFYRTELDPTWQTGRIEVFTKRGAARLTLVLAVTRDGQASGQDPAHLRNVRLTEGGFPGSTPVPGMPYLKWIEALRSNADVAKARPLLQPNEFKLSEAEVKARQADVAPYMELPLARLLELMPEQRPDFRVVRWPQPRDPAAAYAPWTVYRWDPREPNVLKNADGTVVDLKTLYPVTGEEAVTTPTGKTVKYPYHDPPGTKPGLTEIVGDLTFPATWRVFGPLKQADPVPPAETLAAIPAEIKVAGASLAGRDVPMANDGIDLGALLGGQADGKTAYAFADVTVDKETDVTLGAGADWWMQWWVNGQPVYDTLKNGNEKHPPQMSDHVFRVRLKPGKNTVAVRVVSGTASFRFVAAGPGELRNWRTAQGEDWRPIPPRERVYLNRFMPTVRIAELARAGYTLAALYRTTGNREYAVRAATILYALSRAIPEWPFFGQHTWPKLEFLFFPADAYEYWFAFILGCYLGDEGGEMGWHAPAMGTVSIPATMYDALRDTDVWAEVSDIAGTEARTAAEQALLHIAKVSLKCDAYRREWPWQYYHNTLGTQLQALIQIGRATGCPELVHYAVGKGVATFRVMFMADGMFPESVSYLHDMGGGMEHALSLARGYSDPPGYQAALDGQHFEDFNPAKAIAIYGRAMELKDQRLYFPDGTPLTIHDTWQASVTGGPTGPERSPPQPFLLPDFGHAILGGGGKPNWLEAHLHYSGTYNHRHFDMLNLTLWAYGDELACDLGYTHLGGYCVGSVSHNLVVVDSACQQSTHRGDLIAWWPRLDAAQAAQAGDVQAYPQARQYRRTVVTVPFGPGRDAVVDIFEVDGGTRHEWVANGCADYPQKMETNLALDAAADGTTWQTSAADDGRILTKKDWTAWGGDPNHLVTPYDAPGKKSVLYGAFRRVGAPVPWQVPWQVTMTAKPPVPEGTPGASPRATSKDPKPGLRLHWLAPADGEPILCWAPRNRYWQELSHEDEAAAAWDKNLMPKVIVRRDGKDLASRFVAVWEPFPQQPWLTEARAIPEVPAADGLGIALRLADASATVLYRHPESANALRLPGLTSNARFTVLRTEPQWTSLDLYDGVAAAAGPMSVTLTPLPALPVAGQGGDRDAPWLTLKGSLDGYPADASGQPHAGQFVRLIQDGQASWWLPVARVEPNADGTCRVHFSREIGFAYDVERKLLRETLYPYRLLRGAARVSFPVGANLKWRLGENGARLKIAASSHATIRLATALPAASVRVRHVGTPDWKELTAKRDAEALVIDIPSELAGPGWTDIEIGTAP
ncbi:MAG: hypothetical protein A3K19_05345 [Lentisphaerae bacterium RIFOXYB12_FULL_65_16]|nr:MAG: hypothetical protein A3K18_15875 [Lentisphaerae bacterium RIFOXYA12_64_32]OGV94316.1 MAG: hypothetical protein A3K19_05345 [Lentisphaerae bacterium RIFOXYB12_FULL_65_16]